MPDWVAPLIATIPGAVFALWVFWSRTYFPFRQARETEEASRRYEQDARQQERQQQSQADALTALLEITKRLTEHLISLTDRQDGKLADIRKQLSDMKTFIEISSRDWSRLNEVIADIDLVMNRIEAAIKVSEYNEDRESVRNQPTRNHPGPHQGR